MPVASVAEKKLVAIDGPSESTRYRITAGAIIRYGHDWPDALSRSGSSCLPGCGPPGGGPETPRAVAGTPVRHGRRRPSGWRPGRSRDRSAPAPRRPADRRRSRTAGTCSRRGRAELPMPLGCVQITSKPSPKLSRYGANSSPILVLSVAPGCVGMVRPRHEGLVVVRLREGAQVGTAGSFLDEVSAMAQPWSYLPNMDWLLAGSSLPGKGM